MRETLQPDRVITATKTVTITTVLLAALGYFVDIYDLILFSVVRVASLRSLGVSDEHLLSTGVWLLNLQMIGMLLGGLFFGILGDKKGRISVLFSSILLYSLATLANAFVNSIEVYGLLRFIAGIGLAGELGIAITLVSEIMSKSTRGYGTAFVAGIGACGGIAAMTAGYFLSWRTSYVLGGAMGLVLLVLRMKLIDSVVYTAIRDTRIPKGNLKLLFSNRKNTLTYVSYMFIGLPMWFVFGVLATFSPEFGKINGIETISAGLAIAFGGCGLALGDISSSLLSQYLQSRKKAIAYFLLFFLLTITLYLFNFYPSEAYIYGLYVLMGYASGYWASFITMTAESFGTNLRATVATSIPNFVRGLVVPCTLLFSWLNNYFSLTISAFIVGILSIIGAIFGLIYVKETFNIDLNYVENK